MGLFNNKQYVDDSDSYKIEPGHQRGKELPGVAGYTDAKLAKKESMPAIRFKFVRPDGRPD
jgi:hypothetical protein